MFFEDLSRIYLRMDSIFVCLEDDVNFLRGVTFTYTYTLSRVTILLIISLKAFFFFFFFVFHDHRKQCFDGALAISLKVRLVFALSCHTCVHRRITFD